MDDDLVLNLVVDDDPSAKNVSNKKGGKWTDRYLLYIFYLLDPIEISLD
jgi:hypothetical protein